MDSFEVPDFIGYLHGFRRWRAIVCKDDVWLESLVSRERWVPGSLPDGTAYLSAFCPNAGIGAHREPPDESCNCGIYAWKDEFYLWNEGYEPVERRGDGVVEVVVAGEVQMWGKFMGAERGYRCQHARIYALEVPRYGFHGDVGPSPEDLAARLARTYRVDVAIGD